MKLGSYITHGSSRRCFRRDDESGLTTLEWLLIVAAVAGLAALAVVLVTNVVDDTAEQISGSSARVTAATLAAQKIMDDAVKPSAEQVSGAKTKDAWTAYYRDRCNRLAITYGDAGITVASYFVNGASSSDDPVTAITQTATALSEREKTGTYTPPGTTHAICRIVQQ